MKLNLVYLLVILYVRNMVENKPLSAQNKTEYAMLEGISPHAHLTNRVQISKAERKTRNKKDIKQTRESRLNLSDEFVMDYAESTGNTNDNTNKTKDRMKGSQLLTRIPDTVPANLMKGQKVTSEKNNQGEGSGSESMESSEQVPLLRMWMSPDAKVTVTPVYTPRSVYPFKRNSPLL